MAQPIIATLAPDPPYYFSSTYSKQYGMNDVQIIIRFHSIHLADFDGVIYGTRAHVHTMTIYFHQWKSCLRFNKITFKAFYLCDIMSRDTHKKSEPGGWLSIMWNVCSSGENYHAKGCESWNCCCCRCCCSLLLYFSAIWTICTIRFGRGPCYAGRTLFKSRPGTCWIFTGIAPGEIKCKQTRVSFSHIFLFFMGLFFCWSPAGDFFRIKKLKTSQSGSEFLWCNVCLARTIFRVILKCVITLSENNIIN